MATLNTNQPKKREQVAAACNHCKAKKLKCGWTSANGVCDRCNARNISGCVRHVAKKRGGYRPKMQAAEQDATSTTLGKKRKAVAHDSDSSTATNLKKARQMEDLVEISVPSLAAPVVPRLPIVHQASEFLDHSQIFPTGGTGNNAEFITRYPVGGFDFDYNFGSLPPAWRPTSLLPPGNISDASYIASGPGASTSIRQYQEDYTHHASYNTSGPGIFSRTGQYQGDFSPYILHNASCSGTSTNQYQDSASLVTGTAQSMNFTGSGPPIDAYRYHERDAQQLYSPSANVAESPLTSLSASGYSVASGPPPPIEHQINQINDQFPYSASQGTSPFVGVEGEFVPEMDPSVPVQQANLTLSITTSVPALTPGSPDSAGNSPPLSTPTDSNIMGFYALPFAVIDDYFPNLNDGLELPGPSGSQPPFESSLLSDDAFRPSLVPCAKKSNPTFFPY